MITKTIEISDNVYQEFKTNCPELTEEDITRLITIGAGFALYVQTISKNKQVTAAYIRDVMEILDATTSIKTSTN